MTIDIQDYVVKTEKYKVMLDGVQEAYLSGKMEKKDVASLLNLSQAIHYCILDISCAVKYLYIVGFTDGGIGELEEMPSMNTMCCHIKFSDKKEVGDAQKLTQLYFTLCSLEQRLKALLSLVSQPSVGISTISVEKK